MAPTPEASPDKGSKQPAETPDVLDTAPPQPQPQPQPGAADAPGPAPESPEGLSADEEAELARLTEKRDRAAAGQDRVRMKVELPHCEMTHGGVTIGSEFTDVPAFMAAALESAAQSAGVTLTREN